MGANGYICSKSRGIYTVSKSQKSTQFNVQVEDGQLTMDVHDADIRQLIREISKQSGINIVLEKGTQGKVSARLMDVELDTGLAAALSASGFNLAWASDVYRVGNAQNVTPTTVTISKEGMITLDVKNANLVDLVRSFCNSLNLNLVIFGGASAQVNAKLVNQPLDITLDRLFEGTNLAYLKEDNFLWVGQSDFKRPGGERFNQQKVFELKYIQADDVMRMLPPTIPAQNLKHNPLQNLIVAIGPRNLQTRIEEFLDSVDREDRAVVTEVVHLEYLQAEDFLNLFTPSTAVARAIKVDLKQNALVITATRLVLDQIKRHIKIVDVPAAEVRSHLVRLWNLRADEIVKLLPKSLKFEGVSVLEGQNALLVSCTNTTLARLNDFIAEIDHEIPQVIIDVMIVEYSLNKARQMGIESGSVAFNMDLRGLKIGDMRIFEDNFALGQHTYGVGNSTNFASSDKRGDAGLGFTIHSLVENGVAEVRANPRVLTLNGHDATIGVKRTTHYKVTIDTPDTSGNVIVRTVSEQSILVLT